MLDKRILKTPLKRDLVLPNFNFVSAVKKHNKKDVKLERTTEKL